MSLFYLQMPYLLLANTTASTWRFLLPWITEWMTLLLGFSPRSDSGCGQTETRPWTKDATRCHVPRKSWQTFSANCSKSAIHPKRKDARIFFLEQYNSCGDGDIQQISLQNICSLELAIGVVDVPSLVPLGQDVTTVTNMRPWRFRFCPCGFGNYERDIIVVSFQIIFNAFWPKHDLFFLFQTYLWAIALILHSCIYRRSLNEHLLRCVCILYFSVDLLLCCRYDSFSAGNDPCVLFPISTKYYQYWTRHWHARHSNN